MDVREKLVELLMQVEDNMCDDCGREPVGCAVVAIADHLIANGVTISDPLKAGKECVSMDYEAEYHKLLEKHSLLYADYQAMESEFVRMRAQLDIVHLIFSK